MKIAVGLPTGVPGTLSRAGRLADGYLAMPLPPEPVEKSYEAVVGAAEVELLAKATS